MPQGMPTVSGWNTTMSEIGKPLPSAEYEELMALRRENAELKRERLEAEPGAPARTSPTSHVLRWVASAILLVLTCVLTMSAVAAAYLRSEVLDTDRYLATVAPLSSDPVIQAEIADQVTEQITSRVDIEGLTREALAAVTQATPRVAPYVTGLAPVIADQAATLIHDTTARLVATEQFDDLWIQANRRAHQRLVGILTRENDGAVTIDQAGTVTLSVAPIIERVKSVLLEKGVGFARNIPEVNAEITLFQAPALVRAQRAVSTLNTAAELLPWAALACAAGAVAAAPRSGRRRAVIFAGLAFSVAMALLAIGLAIGRGYLLNSIPPDAISPGAAQVLIDTLLVPLRTTLRMVFVLGLVIALAAFLSGPSGAARAVRRGFTHGADFVTGKISSGPAKPWQRWLARHRRILEAAVVAIAALVLIFWTYPTAAVVVTLAVIVVLLVIVIEVLSRQAVVGREAVMAGEGG